MDTPRFEYSKKSLKRSVQILGGLEAPFGMQINYAIKANSNPEILRYFDKEGFHFDASSSYEAQLLLDLGVSGKKIHLSSQQTAHNLSDLLEAGVLYIATSAHQLQAFIDTPNRPKEVGIRINPGIGDGFSNRTTTGGLNSSFGIWHDYLDDILELADSNDIVISHIQQHIGTGTNPEAWGEAASEMLSFVRRVPTATSISLGGGFKTGYTPGQEDADIETIIDRVSDKLNDFHSDTGRKIKLAIEPGRFAVVHAGTLVAEVDDIVDTGKDGHKFLRLNTGMNDILRPSMYGAYHEIEVINDSDETEDYIVAGHNCETGDTLTTAKGDPECIEPRTMRKASIGDEVRIYDAGAYCASMSAKGYNAYPDAIEVLVD